MKKGQIRLIPLQADLCLNKQKVDIEDFKGWNKCNAPVYGNCLSPLYKKEDTHHDFFIGDDNYDFTDGVLYKNGTAVLSGAGSKKLKKSKITDNYDSMKVTASGILSWAKISAADKVMFKIGNQGAVERTISNARSIYTTKVFGDDDMNLYGVIVWYLHTNGNSGYYIEWEHNETLHQSYGTGNPTTFDMDVLAPMIQVATNGNGVCVITLYGNYGSNISDIQKKNITLYNDTLYENSTFHDDTAYATRYGTDENRNIVNAEIVTSHQRVNLKNSLTTKNYDTMIVEQTVTATLQSPALTDVTVTFWYIDKTDTKQTAYSLVIPQGSTSISKKFTFMFYGYFDSSNWSHNTHGAFFLVNGRNGSTTKPAGFFILPSYAYTSGDSAYSAVGYTATYLANNAPDNPSSAGEDVLTNKDFNNKVQFQTGAGFLEFNLISNGLTVTNIAGQKNNKNLGNQFTSLSDAGSIYSAVMLNYPNLMTQKYGSATLADLGTVIDGKNVSVTRYGAYSSYTETMSVADFTAGTNAKSSPTSTFEYTIKNGGGMPIYAYRKTTYTSNAMKECDCVLDDNRCYTIDNITDVGAELERKLFTLAGTITGFDTVNNQVLYQSFATFNITYESTDDNVYPRYYVGRLLCLQSQYMRIVYMFKANESTDKIIYFEIDTTAIRTEQGKNIVLYPGVNKDGTVGNQGSCMNIAGWRLLYNNNLLSNVACYENENYIGTIIADWLTVDTDFAVTCNNDVLYYKDNNNQIWKIEKVTSGEQWGYRVIENRYVVLNTTNYFNCYDIVTGLKRHWASDYNNRVSFGYSFAQYAVTDDFTQKLTMGLFNGLIATGQNANYERTKDYITSVELGALYYKDCLKDFYYFKSCSVPNGAIEMVDVYRGDDGSTSAAYVYSLTNDMRFINTDLTSPAAPYPIAQNGDVRYNPNLFTRFINSYNNKDMVISDNIAYKLLYFNNVIPVMSYYLLDGVEGIEDAFVLQTSYYGVTPTRLYQMNYSNGVGVEVVCDITNLEYLGALPTQALFWSAQNRAIYTFSGNCIMKLSQYANDLEEILGKWYNPATQELFLDTNIGLLVFSDLGTFCLPKFTVEVPDEVEEGEEPTTHLEERDIKDIFFFEDMFIINLDDDTSASYYWSYNPLSEYESNGIDFITKYYGNAKTPITINNIYIRLYNQDIEDAEGEIKLSGHTVTDIGVKTDTKTVAIGGEEGEQWDEETNTMLVKYTPQFNRGLGFALEVQTTFPIIDIKFDYVDDVAIEGQLSHVNV